MAQFGSSKRLGCWASLTPRNNESAGKKNSVRISCAGVYLKSALVQAARAAVEDKANPYYVLKYVRIAKRRGKKRAIIAITGMILTAIFSMLSTGEAWNPVDLFKVDCLSISKNSSFRRLRNRLFDYLNPKDLRCVSHATHPLLCPKNSLFSGAVFLCTFQARLLFGYLSH